jgi:hypothetical protein
MAAIRIRNSSDALKHSAERNDILSNLLEQERTRSEELLRENENLKKNPAPSPEVDGLAVLGEISISVLKSMFANRKTYIDTRTVRNNDGSETRIDTCRNCGCHGGHSSRYSVADIKHLDDCPYGLIDQVARLAIKIGENKIITENKNSKKQSAANYESNYLAYDKYNNDFDRYDANGGERYR